jgi:hypothetical protein
MTITRFNTVVLTRKNGKRRVLEYKTERALTDDLLYSICSKLRITGPTWNAYSQDFEFDDTFWLGSDAMAPDTLQFLDAQGWNIEGFEEEE